MSLLYFDEWRETRATIRYIAQIMGKCCLEVKQEEPLYKHVMLSVSQVGLSTGLLQYKGQEFGIDLDLIDQQLVVTVNNNETMMIVETGKTIQSYYEFIFNNLRENGIDFAINTKPYNIPYDKTLDKDDTERVFDPKMAYKALRLMQQAQYDHYQFLHSKNIKDVKTGLFWDKFDVTSIFYVEGNHEYTVSLCYYFGDKYRESPYYIIKINPFKQDKINLKQVEPSYAEYNGKDGSFLMYEEDLESIMRRDEVLLTFFNSAYQALLSGVSSQLKDHKL
ncbi:DUF5996 family protein [Mammaliicoccus stepanovicii]|uniref:Uncharacterized protein n=1 Tax=Mammaliicoccus stepanovicii TaxID=643214 RepID=A0A239YXM7_9STAP|nr:DUF5996 family protein [Mammaliicoccus stepanovicii]PNZ74408.1 hypothetical protein CD111_08860 [Mammaliicoccus stepanovicii]GGI40527.1 hypothetical protein GCM10010896_08820 [Mammaliicoccus stepanovicii]SNV63552.1 Uncharacterised protein [Mammaliicoccus stepanovicii]